MDLPLDEHAAFGILEEKGFHKVEVDVVALAESLVGKAEWKLPSRQWEAPNYFDCSSFTKWLYGQCGISIPRRPKQHFDFCRTEGRELICDELLTAGDLLFVTSPFVHGIRTDEHDGIGHVCLMADAGNVICATNSEFGKGVVMPHAL
jgi:cell wall-associated NlpC family hydrolase